MCELLKRRNDFFKFCLVCDNLGSKERTREKTTNTFHSPIYKLNYTPLELKTDPWEKEGKVEIKLKNKYEGRPDNIFQHPL